MLKKSFRESLHNGSCETKQIDKSKEFRGEETHVTVGIRFREAVGRSGIPGGSARILLEDKDEITYIGDGFFVWMFVGRDIERCICPKYSGA